MTAAAISSLHGGAVPEGEDALLSLPFIGHYTTAAVRCFGFGHRAVIVDTNTMRLASRVFGTPAPQRSHRRPAVRALVSRLYIDSQGGGPSANYALLDLAATVCRPRLPACPECPLRPDCDWAATYDQRRDR